MPQLIVACHSALNHIFDLQRDDSIVVGMQLQDALKSNDATHSFNRGNGYYLEVMHRSNDLGEGPWQSKQDALDFFKSEVGVICRVLAIADGNVKPVSKWLDPD